MSVDAADGSELELAFRQSELAGYAAVHAALSGSGEATHPAVPAAGTREPAPGQAAFGLGLAAGVIDALRDAIGTEPGEGLQFAVAELAFDYMGARELVSAAAIGVSGVDAQCAAVAVGELLRRCTDECLALGARTDELRRLRELLSASDVRVLAARDEASLERMAEIVLDQPAALMRIGQDER